MTNATTAMFNDSAASYSRRRLVPCFDAFYSAALRALELAEPGELRTVLDLGTGTGVLAAMIARAHPDAQLTLLDGAPAMVEKAAATLGARAAAAVVSCAPAGCSSTRSRCSARLHRSTRCCDAGTSARRGRFAVLAGRRAA